MSDIAERLRELTVNYQTEGSWRAVFVDAAAEIDRLRDALEAIVFDTEFIHEARVIARAALAKEAGQSPADKWEEEIQ
jgi:hypothetical protein